VLQAASQVLLASLRAGDDGIGAVEVRCIPDGRRCWPMTVSQLASTTPEPTNKAALAETTEQLVVHAGGVVLEVAQGRFQLVLFMLSRDRRGRPGRCPRPLPGYNQP
jgi:hypothetical protein